MGLVVCSQELAAHAGAFALDAAQRGQHKHVGVARRGAAAGAAKVIVLQLWCSQIVQPVELVQRRAAACSGAGQVGAHFGGGGASMRGV